MGDEMVAPYVLPNPKATTRPQHGRWHREVVLRSPTPKLIGSEKSLDIRPFPARFHLRNVLLWKAGSLSDLFLGQSKIPTHSAKYWTYLVSVSKDYLFRLAQQTESRS